MQNTIGVTEVQPVPEAYVPVLKIKVRARRDTALARLHGQLGGSSSSPARPAHHALNLPLPPSFPPLLLAQFNGFEMDLLYAHLQLVSIPEDINISVTSILRGCDDQSIRSLNGCRVTDKV